MSLQIFWFCAIAIMVSLYVILDGYDLGAGMVQLLIARSEGERKQMLHSIHPLWDGNEVWLIAAGTTLFFAFPKLYAVSFSGFYLPLIIVLWLLIFRGLAIELRDRIDSPAWKPFWDQLFGYSSLALVLFFGAALGNVVRGVPLEPEGHFFLPLWADFRSAKPGMGILDGYTLSVGIAAVITIVHHGALWIALRTSGRTETQSERLAQKVWVPLFLATLWISAYSFFIQSQIIHNFREMPWGILFPLLGITSLFASFYWNRQGKRLKAFLASTTFIVGLLTSAAFGVFPYVLPAVPHAEQGLTIYNASAPETGLQLGLFWFIPGILLALGYSIFAHAHFSEKIGLQQDH